MGSLIVRWRSDRSRGSTSRRDVRVRDGSGCRLDRGPPADRPARGPPLELEVTAIPDNHVAILRKRVDRVNRKERHGPHRGAFLQPKPRERHVHDLDTRGIADPVEPLDVEHRGSRRIGSRNGLEHRNPADKPEGFDHGEPRHCCRADELAIGGVLEHAAAESTSTIS